MTTATRTAEAPHHNALTCYTDYHCRLPGCVDRFNARARERDQAHKVGTYSGLIDAARARHHIVRLQRAGMSAEAIAKAAGLSPHSILDLLRPRSTKSRGRRLRTTPATEAKILAVTPGNHTVGRIDATGTIRRVQALATLGWPARNIARHAGLAGENATDILRRTRVYAATANAIKAAYDELRTLQPEKHGVVKAQAHKTKNRATRERWVPPKYWDLHPGAIDDPEFEPEYKKLRVEIIAEEAHWLITTFGYDRNEAADRLGVDRTYVDRALREHPQGEFEAAS